MDPVTVGIVGTACVFGLILFGMHIAFALMLAATRRLAEADAFYAVVQKAALSEEEKRIQRQAFAGLEELSAFLRNEIGLDSHTQLG